MNEKSHVSMFNREHVIDQFANCLSRDISSTFLVTLTGHAGVGKSFLMQHLKNMCDEISLPSALISGSLDEITEQGSSVLRELTQYLPTYKPGGTEDAHDLAKLPLFSQFYNQSEDHPPLVDFVMELNHLSKDQKICIFIDVDLCSRSEVRHIFDNFLDKLSHKLIVVLSTRDLDNIPLHWRKRTDLQLKLENFSRQEVFQFLQTHDVNNDDNESIYVFTEGLPYLLSEIAQISGANPQTHYSAISAKYVARVFEELQDQRLEHILRSLAVCRRINLELMGMVSRSQHLQDLYNALRNLSFVETDRQWLKISESIRRHLVRQLLSNSPNRFAELNQKALSYYRRFPVSIKEALYQDIYLESLYHEVCLDPLDGIGKFLSELYKAEAQYETAKCYALRSDLDSYELVIEKSKLDNVRRYCNSTIHRMEYEWENSKNSFVQMLDDKMAKSALLKAHILRSLSEVEQSLGNWKSAIQYAEDAGFAFKEVGGERYELMSLLLTAKSLIRQHRFLEAENMLQKKTEYSQPQDALLLFELNLACADLYRSQGLWDRSREFLDKAALFSDELQSKVLSARVLYILGKLYRGRHDWKAAQSYYERSIELLQDTEARLELAQVYHSLASIMIRVGAFPQAEELLSRSQEIKLNINDKFGLAKNFNSLGHIRRLTGNHEEALAMYKKSLGLFSQTGNRVKESRVLCRIGMTLASQGSYQEAKEYLSQSYELRINIFDQQGISETLFELGRVQERNAETLNAVESYRLSLEHAKQAHALSRQFVPAIHLAILLYSQGQLQQASDLFTYARSIAKQSRQYELLANALQERGLYEGDMKQYETAMLCFAEAIYAASHEGDNSVVTLLQNILHLLDTISEVESVDVRDSYAKRVFRYWSTSCRPIPINSRFWSAVDLLSGEHIDYYSKLQDVRDQLGDINPKPRRID